MKILIPELVPDDSFTEKFFRFFVGEEPIGKGFVDLIFGKENERRHGSRHLDFELWALLINLYLLDSAKNSAKDRAMAEIRRK